MEREEEWTYDYHQDWMVILCDLAEGSGGDFTVFQVLQWDGTTLHQRARWRCNQVTLDVAAFILFFLCSKVFHPEHTIVSLEWNTYGAYFYKCLIGLLDTFPGAAFDPGCLVWYPKSTEDLDIFKNSKKLPGLRMTASSKKTSCMLLKNEFEKELLYINDAVTIAEIENFEQVGASYAAVRGHDDTVMPLVQIPKLKETAKWTEFCEEFQMAINPHPGSDFDAYDYVGGGTGLFGAPSASDVDYNPWAAFERPTENSTMAARLR